MERQRAAKRHRRSLQPRRACTGAPAEFAKQTALADAGIAGNEQTLPSPLLHLPEKIVEQRELAFARDERRRVLIRVGQPQHTPRPLIVGRSGRRLELEPTLEERTGRGRGHDQIIRRGGEQCLENALR